MTINRSDLSSTTITLNGSFLRYITGNGLYLSSTNSSFNLSAYDFYTNIKLVSADNPVFYGTPLTDYTIISDSEVKLNLPENLPPGEYDIVFCNPAGYVTAKSNKKFKGLVII